MLVGDTVTKAFVANNLRYLLSFGAENESLVDEREILPNALLFCCAQLFPKEPDSLRTV